MEKDKKGVKPCSRYNTLTTNIIKSINKKLGTKMDTPGANFQYARLSEESGTWRICWYNRHPDTGDLQRIRKTCNLNRIQPVEERRRVAQILIDHINGALVLGWNFFTDVDITQPDTAIQPGGTAKITLLQAITQAHRIRCIGFDGRTLSSYSSYTNTFTAWLQAQPIAAMPPGSFTPLHYYDYLAHKQQAGHGNRNLNQSTFYLKSLFKIMIDKLQVINTNPLANIDPLPEAESTRFLPITPDEMNRIIPALIAYNPRYYMYCKFLPHEFIRPHHIARLHSSDINYTADEITLGGATTKSKRNTTKQLIKPMKDALIAMGYNTIPGNHYLFANKDFEPGPALYPRLSITAAEIWRRIVIEGMGINKQLYALKHTSAQYFVNNNANIDVYYLRQQMEHTSAAMTEKYLQHNVKKKVKAADVNTLKF